MKEHPILFSGEMVRAILAGTKTQTRRVAKLNYGGRLKAVGSYKNWHPNDPNAVFACPYGQPGDRLWVRETWAPNHRAPAGAEDRIPYCLYFANGDGERGQKWRPSIFMRRHSSRITLEIETVRIERLNDISNEDCIAEGIEPKMDAHIASHIAATPEWSPLRMEYWALWKSINGPDSWAQNPWVWVIEFKRITP